MISRIPEGLGKYFPSPLLMPKNKSEEGTHSMTNDEIARLTRNLSRVPAEMIQGDIWGTNLPNGMLLWFGFDFEWAAVAKEITSAEWDVVRGRLKVNHAKCDTLLEASKALLRKSGLARWDDQTFAFVPMYPGNEDYEFEEHWKEEFHSRFGRYMAWVLFSVGAENLAKAACVCNKAVDPLGTHLQVQVLHVLDHHLPGSRRRGRAPTETICYCRVVTDVGGGLNFQRKGLVALLERLHRGDKLRIVVAHRDRLARSGFDLIRWMAEQNGGEIVALPVTSPASCHGGASRAKYPTEPSQNSWRMVAQPAVAPGFPRHPGQCA